MALLDLWADRGAKRTPHKAELIIRAPTCALPPSWNLGGQVSAQSFLDL